MQRSINIQNATINALADIQFGLATVVANAAAGTTSMRGGHAVSKCSDPGKSGDPSPRRWRGSGSTYRHEHRQVVAVHPVVTTGVCGSPPTTPSTLPPTLWAAWVLSQSLCG